MASPKRVEFTIGVRDRTRRALRAVTRRLRELARSAAETGARVAAVAAAGFAVLTRAALKSARGLKDVADQLNISTDFLQAFQNAAREGGVSIEAASTFLQRFITNLGKARQGQVSFVKAFADAGIRGGDLLKDPLEVLDQLLANVNELDQVSRQAIVSPIGDVEGVKTVNALLGQSLDTVKKIQEFGGQFGIISPDTIARLDDAATKFQRAFQSAKPGIFGKLADVLDKITPLVPGFISALIGFAGAVERLAGFVGRNVRAARQALGGDEVIPGGRGRGSAAFEAQRAANLAANRDLVLTRDLEGNRRIMIKIERNTRSGANYGQ